MILYTLSIFFNVVIFEITIVTGRERGESESVSRFSCV